MSVVCRRKVHVGSVKFCNRDDCFIFFLCFFFPLALPGRLAPGSLKPQNYSLSGHTYSYYACTQVYGRSNHTHFLLLHAHTIHTFSFSSFCCGNLQIWGKKQCMLLFLDFSTGHPYSKPRGYISVYMCV